MPKKYINIHTGEIVTIKKISRTDNDVNVNSYLLSNGDEWYSNVFEEHWKEIKKDYGFR